jgi:hypothetical protein
MGRRQLALYRSGTPTLDGYDGTAGTLTRTG